MDLVGCYIKHAWFGHELNSSHYKSRFDKLSDSICMSSIMS
jgi:hypothetical protein